MNPNRMDPPQAGMDEAPFGTSVTYIAHDMHTRSASGPIFLLAGAIFTREFSSP